MNNEDELLEKKEIEKDNKEEEKKEERPNKRPIFESIVNRDSKKRKIYDKPPREGEYTHAYYARMAAIPYLKDDIQKKSIEKLNLELVDDTHKKTLVLKHKETGEYYMVHKGTDPTDPADLIADVAIAKGEDHNSVRLKTAKKIYDKHKKHKPIQIGHSLGGTMARHIAMENGLRAHVFAPGQSLTYYKSKKKGADITTHLTRGVDPISFLNRFSSDEHVMHNWRFEIGHGIKNFF